MSDLAKRIKKLPALHSDKKKIRRRFMTVGDRRHNENHETRTKRRQQLRTLRLEERNRGMSVRRSEQKILKPASGIYGMWERLGLARQWSRKIERSRYSGLASGFNWPPPKPFWHNNQTKILLL